MPSPSFSLTPESVSLASGDRVRVGARKTIAVPKFFTVRQVADLILPATAAKHTPSGTAIWASWRAARHGLSPIRISACAGRPTGNEWSSDRRQSAAPGTEQIRRHRAQSFRSSVSARLCLRSG
jgi:hypothetical protein